MNRGRLSCLATILLASMTVPAYAQLATGNVYGTVQDDQGAVLPGAAATLTGATIGTRTTVSGSQGDFRFLNLDPGQYTISIALPNFAKVARAVTVATGSNVSVGFTLKMAQVEETITVTAETPVVEPKKTGTSTTFSQDELAKVPNSRDPWALLRTVPGVVLDRVNIAGNESGQQSLYRAKGARFSDGVWSLDGINITDMAATGASPTYFDYDAFEEIQVSTSGNDIRQPTGGVGINFVSKRGTNKLKGTVRGYFTHDDLEWENVPDELRAAGVTPQTTNHIRQIADYGADLGGPVLKDRLWFWASYGKQDIRLARSAGKIVDKTVLKDNNVKLNWQATSKDMVNVMWFRGAKVKLGRGTGAAAVEAPTAVWNQDDNFPTNGPPGLWKIEENHIFSANLFLNVKYAYYGTGFKLESAGPSDQKAGISALLGQSFGSTRSIYYERPQHTVNLDGNWFMNALGGNHEVKLGVGYRTTKSLARTEWPADRLVAYENSATDRRARLYRDGLGIDKSVYWSAYVGDTLTADRLTVTAGVRWDRQYGTAEPSSVQGNGAFPTLMPGISFAGYDRPFTWNDVSPRLSFSYALDRDAKTLVRSAFAMYAGQLGTEATYLNTAGSVGFVDYPWTDLNGDHFAQPNEVNTAVPPITYGGGFNPNNPTAVTTPNKIDPDYRAPRTVEVVVGFDRELAPNFGVSLAYTWRKLDRFDSTPRIGFTSADYAPGTVVTGTLPDGTPYSVQTYTPNAAKVAATGGGRIRTNYAGFHQTFSGVELAVNKRLSDRWMFRLAASWNSNTEHFEGEPVTAGGQPTPLDAQWLVEGGQVVYLTGGSGAGDVLLNGKWTLNASGLYQLPWGIDVAANLFAKQGTPFGLYRVTALGQDGSSRVAVTPEVDTFRFDDLWNLDLRLAKNIDVAGVSMQVTADLFNVLNTNTEINRNRNIGATGATGFNYLTDNVSPRVLRVGARLSF